MFKIPNAADAEHASQAQHDTRDFDIVISGLSGTGIISGCAVTPQGSPNMTVAVASGSVSVGGTTAAVTGGNVTITTAHATLARFDLICADSSGVKSAVAGTPATDPVFPDPAGKCVLAAVRVPAAIGSINAAKITDKRVTVVGIPDGSIVLQKLAADSVDSSKIVNGSIVAGDIANDTITATQLAAGAVGSSELAAGAALANLAADSVDASKIAANAIGSSELADSAVDTNAIQNDAVTMAKQAIKVQSGSVSGVSGSGITVTFPTAFATTPNVVMTIDADSGSSADGSVPVIQTRSTTGFTFKEAAGGTRAYCWVAVGT